LRPGSRSRPARSTRRWERIALREARCSPYARYEWALGSVDEGLLLVMYERGSADNEAGMIVWR
jgi:hypothetical protein